MENNDIKKYEYLKQFGYSKGRFELMMINLRNNKNFPTEESIDEMFDLMMSEGNGSIDPFNIRRKKN